MAGAASHEDPAWLSPADPYSAGAARGVYNPLQYTVRLRPDLYNLLNEAERTEQFARLGSSPVLSAMSTYLHETIHWWQHVGSTAGLLLSLGYPAQVHVNHQDLRTLVGALGPRKSLRRLDLNRVQAAPDVRTSLNRVLNYWHDIEFCSRLMLQPQNAQAWLSDTYFESVGHSYQIAWSSGLWLLSSTMDPGLELLPDPRTWADAFNDLERRRVTGFYYGSRVEVMPVGAREIFEGQARFAQLQYLYFTSGGTLDMQWFATHGMLSGVYVEAFSFFLEILGEDVPPSVDHPLVGLFLLVCDLAINPGEGFPFDILHAESFLISADPASRFYFFAIAVRDRHPGLKQYVTAYSREEYVAVSELLTAELVSPSPMDIASRVGEWVSQSARVRELMEEDRTFRFADGNLPVRVFLTRFIRFQQDKQRWPQYFTWPGVYMMDLQDQEVPLERAHELFREHEPLFLHVPDGEVRPRLMPGRDPAAVQETFDQFYIWNASYALVRQWIAVDGPFRFDFEWLTNRFSNEDLTRWASEIFEEDYGVSPGQFEIV